MRIIVRPNLSWVIMILLTVFWLLGFMNAWIAVSLFIVYVLVAFNIMKRDPAIQREAQEFARQLEENRIDKKKERIKQALLDSVQIHRKGNEAD